MRTQSTATKTMVNAIRRVLLTSLLGTGEVYLGLRKQKDLVMKMTSAAVSVVGGSRLRKGCTCKSRRPPGKGWALKVHSGGVRAIIVVKKRGNACGAKGGR